VTISGFEENGMATISVADTGIGIPPEKHQDVFTPFTRLGQETLAIEGTGIGLTITKQIVEIMGGKIGFESIPGQGSTFWVAFPVSENKEGKTVSPASDPDRRNLGDDAFSVLATILYVEDDAVNILLMKEIMKRWTNYTLVVRKSAEKGIEAARLLNPDLILMDITLPGISGIDAFLLLQQKPETHDIPVVALSANFESETVKRCLDLGFYDYLCKPLDIRVLQVTIASALKGEKR
jgi:CheY-like chemotaxis protein